MAVLTLSIAAGGLVATTILVAQGSALPAPEAADLVCENIASGDQRSVPATGHCQARTEFQVEQSGR